MFSLLRVFSVGYQVEKEIAIMKKLDHPNIVRLFEASISAVPEPIRLFKKQVVDDIDGDKLFMFMEYVALGPVVRRNPKTNCFTSSATGHICEEAAAGRYLLDITSGIRYLHLHNIICGGSYHNVCVV